MSGVHVGSYSQTFHSTLKTPFPRPRHAPRRPAGRPGMTARPVEAARAAR